MNQAEVIKRKIKLKRQAVAQITLEIQALQEHLMLIVLKNRYEKRIGNDYEPMLSRKIDGIQFMLENEKD